MIGICFIERWLAYHMAEFEVAVDRGTVGAERTRALVRMLRANARAGKAR